MSVCLTEQAIQGLSITTAEESTAKGYENPIETALGPQTSLASAFDPAACTRHYFAHLDRSPDHPTPSRASIAPHLPVKMSHPQDADGNAMGHTVAVRVTTSLPFMQPSMSSCIVETDWHKPLCDGLPRRETSDSQIHDVFGFRQMHMISKRNSQRRPATWRVRRGYISSNLHGTSPPHHHQSPFTRRHGVRD
jgi:hypothetical protein